MSDVIDRDRTGRLASLKERMRRLGAVAAATLWEYGIALAEVRRDELWREDGSRTWGEWTERFAGMSEETADKAIAIAQHFTREMAERWGSEKLYATVEYLNATKRIEQAGDAQTLEFRLQAPNGRWMTVPFVEASYRDIEQATALLQATRKGQRKAAAPQPEPHVREKALRLADELPAAPKGTVRGDRVIVKQGKDGRTAVTIQGIPLDELPAVVAAMRKHLS